MRQNQFKRVCRLKKVLSGESEVKTTHQISGYLGALTTLYMMSHILPQYDMMTWSQRRAETRRKRVFLQTNGFYPHYTPLERDDVVYNTAKPQSYTWQQWVATRMTGINFTTPFDINGGKPKSQAEFFIKLLEDVSIFVFQMCRQRDANERSVAILNFVKLRYGERPIGPIIVKLYTDIFNDIFGLELQSTENPFSTIRGYLDNYDEVKQSALFKKMYKFIMYCMSMSLFDKLGISFDKFKYTQIEQEALRLKFHMGPDFIHCMLDTLVFLCERGLQCYKTGKLDPLYHSGSAYEEWFDKCFELKRQAQFISNPEPHGFNIFSFTNDLNIAIEKGTAIARHASICGEIERRAIKNMLASLEYLKATEITRRAAQEDRVAPLAFLLYGGSSVGKSLFSSLLYKYYGKIFGLQTTPEFKYTRNPVDEYWVNFNSSQWCIQLDDIGFMHPNHAAAGDPSLMEMLQVINNVPFVPTQADLADKGKTPVRSRLVIATTNTEDLNANDYFSCPLAVLRRLPWVIDIQPKPEYTKDICMLDGGKLPEIASGELPDFWNITVKKIVPVLGKYDDPRRHQSGKTEVFAKFTSIYEFLMWYVGTAKDYSAMQDKALRCSAIIDEVELCTICCLPAKHCFCLPENQCVKCSRCHLLSDKCQCGPILQSSDTHVVPYNEDRVQEILDERRRRLPTINEEFHAACEGEGLLYKLYLGTIIKFTMRYVTHTTFRTLFESVFGKYLVPSIVIDTCCTFRFGRVIFRAIGNRVESRIGTHKLITAFLGTVATTYGMYKVYSMMTRKDMNETDPQGGVSSTTGRAPTPNVEERYNPWYKDDYQTTAFEVSSNTTSWARFSESELNSMLTNNTAFLRMHRDIDGVAVNRPTRAIAVGGHVWMMNNHAVPQGNFEMEIIQSFGKDGVTSNLRFLVTPGMIHRVPSKDLAFMEIRNIPPRKDISSLFCHPDLFGGHKGYYLSKNFDGSIFTKVVHNIKLIPQFLNSHFENTISTWAGKVNEPTKNGDCGSMLISQSSFGPIILGMHYLGENDDVYAIKITIDDVLQGQRYFKTPIISPNPPSLVAPSATKVVGSLAKKSPVRYIDSGTANVYGSYQGFRAKPKSSVGPTIIRDSMLKRGFEVKTGAPVMSGWQPWRAALQDMVKPTTMMNQDILTECKDSFIQDILSKLTKTDLSEVFVYDKFTAINGAPGVTYVDKINRNTSAGEPFNKSKKFFMKAIPEQNGLPDPVEVSQEILDRVDECLGKYQKGERFSPVFCGHLKDEATPFKKIRDAITRVFTGAPLEYTIVVRMHLLSVIRLIQKNRFIFEAGPGTIAQSLEWEQIYEHLTKFGTSRIVAGDYKAFDKKMGSILILAAFDILIAICKRAGYSETELLVLQGIAEDTAFAFVNFNGDLIEFFGCNPSGHPLTVIINGLVNSLYMRYCYRVLNPNAEVRSFQRRVALMTYGDDNVQGVCSTCSWYNHTSIQETLSAIGIVYTMADKESESIPYIHINDVSFLKRTFTFDADIGAIIAPLEADSIAKMLTTCVRSKTITQEEQVVSIMQSALREWFFYGRTIFKERRAMLLEVVYENNLDFYVNENTFPTWEQLYLEFWRASEHVNIKRYVSRPALQCSWNNPANLYGDETPEEFAPELVEHVDVCLRCENSDCEFRTNICDDYFHLCETCGYCVEDGEYCECGAPTSCDGCGGQPASVLLIFQLFGISLCLECLSELE